MFAYAGSPSEPLPGDGVPVDAGDALAVRRARELANVLPLWHAHDEGHYRFFAYELAGGAQGVGAVRRQAAARVVATLGDTPGAWDSGGASWWLLGGALALVAGVVYVATRPVEAHAPSDYRGADTRGERNERVEQDLPPELVPLWRKMRGQFRGGTPHERAVRFQEYADTDEGERARLELLEQESGERTEAFVLERDGCVCNDNDSPRCCGRGCCSWHRGIRGRVDEGDEVPF